MVSSIETSLEKDEFRFSFREEYARIRGDPMVSMMLDCDVVFLCKCLTGREQHRKVHGAPLGLAESRTAEPGRQTTAMAQPNNQAAVLP
jgi:hypothetical protein